MITNVTRFPQHLLVGLGGMLIAVTLAGDLALMILPRFSLRAFAASLHLAAGKTCAQAPTMEHCHNQDLERQGCVADAVTPSQANIVENGFTIGSVEWRFS